MNGPRWCVTFPTTAPGAPLVSVTWWPEAGVGYIEVPSDHGRARVQLGRDQMAGMLRVMVGWPGLLLP